MLLADSPLLCALRSCWRPASLVDSCRECTLFGFAVTYRFRLQCRCLVNLLVANDLAKVAIGIDRGLYTEGTPGRPLGWERIGEAPGAECC
jgi:hypothetical protein